MANHEISTIIILSEIVLLETLAIIGVLIYFFIRLKKRSELLRNMINTFTGNKENRRESILSNIVKPSHINEDEYNRIIYSIIDREDEFYKYVIDIFHKNDTKSLDTLLEEINKNSQPYYDLLRKNDSEDKTSDKSAHSIDVDNAIEELLADDVSTEKTDNADEQQNDPALDLSETADVTESATDETPDISDEIEEIPNSLLDETPDFSAEDESQDNSSSQDSAEVPDNKN